MIAHGLPIYLALEPVDMRLGAERLGALVREKMEAEPRSRALFVFVGKRGHSMKVLTWDGTGTIVVHKKLDAGRFELPRATTPGHQHLQVSDALFDVIHKGVARTPRTVRPSRVATASAGTDTPTGTAASAPAGGASSRKATRTPMSGTTRSSRSSRAMRTFTVALLRSAVGTMAITSAGIFQSG